MTHINVKIDKEVLIMFSKMNLDFLVISRTIEVIEDETPKRDELYWTPNYTNNNTHTPSKKAVTSEHAELIESLYKYAPFMKPAEPYQS